MTFESSPSIETVAEKIVAVEAVAVEIVAVEDLETVAVEDVAVVDPSITQKIEKDSIVDSRRSLPINLMLILVSQSTFLNCVLPTFQVVL